MTISIAIGCNSLLDNEPGRLDRGASTTRDPGASSSTDTDGTTPAEPISGSETDASVPPSPPPEGPGNDAGTGCTTGSKACGDLCVSTEDPFFGCGAPSCARCELPNATAACALGACAIGTCTVGFADCNALPADGCEANLQTVNDCGGCGLKCPVLENVQMACVSGTCTGVCAPGFGDCNGKAEDGCERDLTDDKKNCGACGTRCVIGRCEQGACIWP